MEYSPFYNFSNTSGSLNCKLSYYGTQQSTYFCVLRHHWISASAFITILVLDSNTIFRTPNNIYWICQVIIFTHNFSSMVQMSTGVTSSYVSSSTEPLLHIKHRLAIFVNSLNCLGQPEPLFFLIWCYLLWSMKKRIVWRGSTCNYKNWNVSTLMSDSHLESTMEDLEIFEIWQSNSRHNSPLKW